MNASIVKPAVQLRRLLVFDLLCYTQTIAFTELVAFIINNSYINCMYMPSGHIAVTPGPYLRGGGVVTVSSSRNWRKRFFWISRSAIFT